MLKRTLVLILAGCLMLGTASFAEKEPDVSDAVNGIVYEDEYLTMRLGQIISEEDSVSVTITFENNGTRYCAVMAGITKGMMEDDALKALRLMQQINGGEFARTIAPEETVTYNISWNTGEEYTESLPAMFCPNLQPEEVMLAAEGYPKDTIGGLSVLFCDEDLKDQDLFSAFEGLNETNTKLLKFLIISAE